MRHVQARLARRARYRRDRVEDLEEQLREAQQTWPEWAEKLLRILESWGCEYDTDDEINLPDELADWLNCYASDLKRDAARRPDPMQRGQFDLVTGEKPAPKTEGA